MSEPAMGAPRLEPMFRKTVFREVVRPISLFLTERTEQVLACDQQYRPDRPKPQPGIPLSEQAVVAVDIR